MAGSTSSTKTGRLKVSNPSTVTTGGANRAMRLCSMSKTSPMPRMRGPMWAVFTGQLSPLSSVKFKALIQSPFQWPCLTPGWMPGQFQSGCMSSGSAPPERYGL